jgi:hypothetical protein
VPTVWEATMNQPRRSDSVGAPKEPGTQGCAYCGAKFGLVRHYYLRKHFCAKKCLRDYKAGLRREVDARLRQWWIHLLQPSNIPEVAPNSDRKKCKAP